MEKKYFREIENHPILALTTNGEELSFSNAKILAAPDEMIYELSETGLEPDEKELYYSVFTKLKETDIEQNLIKMEKAQAIGFISRILEREGLSGKHQIKKLSYIIYKNYAGFGKITSLIEDPDIKYIFCEGLGFPVYVYHSNPRYGFLKTNIQIKKDFEFQNISKNLKIKSRKIHSNSDFLGVLYEKYLVELSKNNREISIKKVNKLPETPRDLVQLKIATPQMLSYLNIAIKNKASVLILGGTPSQRTNLLNSLALLVKSNKKTLSFENSPGLVVPQERWQSKILKLYKKNKISVVEYYLKKNPEFVIADNIEEIKPVISNIKNGCQTFISFNAESFDSAINQLYKKMPAPRIAFMDVVIVLSEKENGWPIIKEIFELHSFDFKTKKIRVRPVFFWNDQEQRFISGKSKLFSQVI